MAKYKWSKHKRIRRLRGFDDPYVYSGRWDTSIQRVQAPVFVIDNVRPLSFTRSRILDEPADRGAANE